MLKAKQLRHNEKSTTLARAENLLQVVVVDRHRCRRFSSSIGYFSRFRKAAAEIENAFPGVEVVGNPQGTSRTGSFEVTDESGKVYWSKLNGQGFPEAGAVVQEMKKAGFTGK